MFSIILRRQRTSFTRSLTTLVLWPFLAPVSAECLMGLHQVWVLGQFLEELRSVSPIKLNRMVGVTVLFCRLLGFAIRSPFRGLQRRGSAQMSPEQIIYYPSFCRKPASPYLLLRKRCQPNFGAYLELDGAIYLDSFYGTNWV